MVTNEEECENMDGFDKVRHMSSHTTTQHNNNNTRARTHTDAHNTANTTQHIDVPHTTKRVQHQHTHHYHTTHHHKLCGASAPSSCIPYASIRHFPCASLMHIAARTPGHAAGLPQDLRDPGHARALRPLPDGGLAALLLRLRRRRLDRPAALPLQQRLDHHVLLQVLQMARGLQLQSTRRTPGPAS